MALKTLKLTTPKIEVKDQEKASDTKVEEKVKATLKQEKEIQSKLQGLLDDSDFTQLTTHRAMQTYAIEKIPDLSKMRPNDLKNKIAELSDQIKIKGLGRKST